ncbi:flagella basal body P-ring formation protein FlgA [Formivibrio citricus]|uniref:Flagella basal body P-ring formation protein FlgA n=1 Tax=Formivibrio citricus TaxID=83765 RepID=A0A1I4XCH0_9NEIS|nr:flagellar basal body P-ring formation chaperone FlgA [Formivibrio citricus]SFN23475.1 flagella basal body P-ring formation protein FlgA [Formivibrio citricus]
MAAVRKNVQSWLDQALANSPGTPSYKIGETDSRLRLDACQDMQISLPTGYRLLGKTMVRVQCISGASWSFSIPIQVSINATYYAAARPLAAGQEIREGDLAPQQGDLAALPGSVVLDPSRAIGRTLNSPVAAGNPLRQEMLRAQIVIRQHQKVRLIFRSGDIEVVNEGTALGNAAEGQPVRVKVSNGQTVQGIARADGSVDMGR